MRTNIRPTRTAATTTAISDGILTLRFGLGRGCARSYSTCLLPCNFVIVAATAEGELMAHEDKGHLEVEDRGAVLIVRVDGGPHGLFGLDIANQLEELVDRVEGDPSVHAVVLTGAHPERFVSHADVRWLQEGGAAVPALGRRGAAAVARVARIADRARVLEPLVRRTPLWGAVQQDRLHATFLRMNASGTIFIAALNGSALGLPAEALANGAVDEVVARDDVLTRASELAEHFGSRPKGAVGAVKRAVYFGGSMSLSEGLHVERTEFLIADQSKDAQDLMLDYLATTEATGELPLYNPGTYARALESGRVPGCRSTNGAVSRR